MNIRSHLRHPFRTLRKAGGAVLFSEANPLIERSMRKQLKIHDLPRLPERYDPREAVGELDARMLESGPALLIGLVSQEKRSLIVLWSLGLLMAAAQLYSPYLIHRLLEMITSATRGELHLGFGLFTAVLLAGVNLLNAILNQHFMYYMLCSRQVLTNVVSRWVYQRALRLRFWDAAGVNIGTVTNHMSTDTERVSITFWLLGDIFYSIITFISVFVMIYYYLGPATLTAPALLLVLLPLIRRVGHRLTSTERDALKYRDDRVNMITQFFAGIRTIKYYAWEEPIRREVAAVRNQELSWRSRWARALSLSAFVFTSIQVLLPLFTFTAYVMLGGHLSIPVVFACIALFQVLVRPIGNMSHIFAGVTDARVAADRLCAFFKGPLRDDAPARELSAPENPIGLTLQGLTVAYDEGGFVGQPIDLRVKAGESIAVVGPIGAGKSTLLLSILGEVKVKSGSIRFDNIGENEAPRLAYTAQTPFIMNASITDNILLSAGGNADVSAAIRASALDEDLTAFPAGVLTEIGENGINLSGGQKHRIALARAYMHAPGLVLLDDPLSAVDVHTERALMQRLIFGEWREITRLVVTHRLEHLQLFDRIVFMEQGRIAAEGTLEHLMAHSTAFQDFYQKHLATWEQPTLVTQTGGIAPAIALTADLTAPSAGEYSIVAEEDQQQGAVSWQIFRRYFHAMAESRAPRALLALLFASIVTASALPILQTAWLSLWLNTSTGITVGGFLNQASRALAPGTRAGLGIYFTLGIAALLAIYFQYLAWIMRSIHAGRVLHNKALRQVLASPIGFFDANPVGRIVNRFASDVDTLETELSWSLQECLSSLLDAVGAILLIVVVMPITLAAFLPLAFLFMNLQRVYRSAARDLRRLGSISRSPRFAHFKETLTGIISIRSYHKQAAFWERYYNTLNDNQRAFYGLTLAARWFSVRLPLLNAVISVIVIIGIIFLAQAGWIAPATAGLVTVYSLGFWMSLNWAIRAYAIAESNMTAAERVLHYCDLPAEPSYLSEPPLATDQPWPQGGRIEVENLCVRYAPSLPLVVENVSFSIPAGARAAIIGKTGSGKTTLIKALFRFVDIASGSIRIDGIDIASVPLERLRRSLAIIPQDPVLFTGTLRHNLDRFGQHSDERILCILEEIRLFELLNKADTNLDTQVTEQGTNYSQGERQLICLARALLSDAKIIILDEPTSSIDVRTDSIVQDAIRRLAAGRTMMIVAHRLNTIHDCDLVIELKEGRALAFANAQQQ